MSDCKHEWEWGERELTCELCERNAKDIELETLQELLETNTELWSIELQALQADNKRLREAAQVVVDIEARVRHEPPRKMAVHSALGRAIDALKVALDKTTVTGKLHR
jgi:hypothetical protein